MHYDPHDYQSYATAFIKDHPECAVFLDCGLGKTVVTLTAIDELINQDFEVHKVLVVAPLRVAKKTWPDEIKKWDHLKDLTFSVVMGTPEERRFALLRQADIYITNRENLQWLISQSGYRFDFDMVVLDELSSFKNHTAKRFKALMRERKNIRRIVGLTGTPASNGLMDLWAEFKTLDMGKRLGHYLTQYRESYFTPDKRNGAIVYSYRLRPGADERIYNAITDMTISMRSMDHINMPELIVNQVKVQMSEEEARIYKAMKQQFVVDLDESQITAANAASLCTKLSQMANGAIYTDNHDVQILHDRKLDALEDIIEAANGKSVMVVYWFKHDLSRIKERLLKLDVTFQELDSEESIDAWNDGKLQVGLVHPASAGHGLNLQGGGNHMVFFSLPWSLELYQQVVGRLWRQGQTSKTVVVQHIICTNTIDERITAVLEHKDHTQNALLEAVKAEIGGHV